jgi:DNA invertase Pin-like site-specific DNA recombinase
MEKPRRCAIYLRVSTLDQKTDLQLDELQTFAASRDWQIVAVYEDKASGTKITGRSEFQRLLKDAALKKFDVVATYKLDRFARSLRDLLNSLQTLTDHGVDFVSAKDPGVDMTTPTGRLLTFLLSAFSEFEASLIKMRVKAGLDAARKRGKRLGRPKLRDDAKIKELRKQGLSIRAIANVLNTSTTAVQRGLK